MILHPAFLGWWTTGQLARVLRVSRQSVARAADKGLLPSERVGTDRRIPHRELVICCLADPEFRPALPLLMPDSGEDD